MSKKTGVGALKLISRRPLLFIFFSMGPQSFFTLFSCVTRLFSAFFTFCWIRIASFPCADRALFFSLTLLFLSLTLSLSLVKLFRSQMVQREQGVWVYHPRRWKRGDLRPPVALESGRFPQFTRGTLFGLFFACKRGKNFLGHPFFSLLLFCFLVCLLSRFLRA